MREESREYGVGLELIQFYSMGCTPETVPLLPTPLLIVDGPLDTITIVTWGVHEVPPLDFGTSGFIWVPTSTKTNTRKKNSLKFHFHTVRCKNSQNMPISDLLEGLLLVIYISSHVETHIFRFPNVP